MGKKIIFIDASKASNIRYITGYNYDNKTFYFDYWDINNRFINKTRIHYSIDDTVIFSTYGNADIYVRSRKYIAPMNLKIEAQDGGSVEGLLYDHISEAFKIFDDINAQHRSEGKAPAWMLEFDLDDRDMSAVFRAALTHLFVAFALGAPACDEAINELYYGYHQSALYNMMVKNLAKRDHKDTVDAVDALRYALGIHSPSEEMMTSRISIEQELKRNLKKEVKAHYDKMYIMAARGNGKTAFAQKQLYRMMLNSTYGIKGGLNMDNLYNFRKNIKEIRRDKKNPGKFLIDTKGGFLSREIVCDGFSKEELYSEEFIETILVIATQIPYDGITKVIFNKEEKMTIIFPNNSYNFSERIIVKANGLDGFDLLCGYSIAKAKMLCSGDGYQWYNKLRKSGKVKL